MSTHIWVNNPVGVFISKCVTVHKNIMSYKGELFETVSVNNICYLFFHKEFQVIETGLQETDNGWL